MFKYYRFTLITLLFVASAATMIKPTIASATIGQSEIPKISILFDETTAQKMPIDGAFVSVEETINNILVIPDNTQLIVRPFNYDDPIELVKASSLIIQNFKNRVEYYKELNELVLQLYIEANSPQNLYQTMKKPETLGYVVVDQNNCIQGIVITRPNVDEASGHVSLQIRRIHTAMTTTCKGIGKSLLTLCAFIAKTHNISSLMTTASMPARGFFEHLGWHGSVIETKYELASNGTSTLLKQFQCTLDVT